MHDDPQSASEWLDRLVALSVREQRAEIDRVRRRDPDLADELEELLTLEDDAEAWFTTLEDELNEHRFAELDAAWAPGQRIGPYRLEHLIGAGGMGAVFLARKADGELKRPVALKLIPPGSLADDEHRVLRRERDTLADLGHPNIAQLFDAGVDENDQPWFAMEYIEGLPLTQWCDRNELPQSERLGLFRDLCAAVLFAHRHLVVHGDIKPANVMVDRYGRLKLLDFGIARMVHASGSAPEGEEIRYFSPAYAAPELKRGRAVSVSSDIYALGMVLRELVASDRLGPVPGELAAIMEKACRDDPDWRYESVSQLVGDLSDYQNGWPVQAYGGYPGYRLQKWLGRHAIGTALGVAMFATVLGFAMYSRYQADIYQRERDKATQLAGFLSEVFVSADPEYAQGHAMTARELLDRGVSRIDRVAADPAVKNDFLMLMGRTYRGLGDFEQARKLFLEAFEIQSKIQDAPVEQQAATLIELGQTEHANGQFEQSEGFFNGALALLESADGSEARLLSARALGKFGRMLGDRGRLDEGLEHIERAVAITRRHPEADAVDLSERLNELASAHFRRGQHRLALEQIEKAMRLRREIDAREGRTSPRTATMLNNIGLMYYLSGQREQAAPYFEEALAMRREILPAIHPDIAQTLTNYGLLLKDDGRLDQATVMLQDALEIRRASLRPDHLRIGQAMHNLAMAHQQNGEFERARELFREAIDKLRDQLGDRHPMIAVAHNDYASLLFDLHELDGAEEHYRIAQRIRNETLPADHPHVAWSLSGLGRVLVAKGRYKEAITLLAEALAIRRGKLPEGDPLIREVATALEEARRGGAKAENAEQQAELVEMADGL